LIDHDHGHAALFIVKLVAVPPRVVMAPGLAVVACDHNERVVGEAALLEVAIEFGDERVEARYSAEIAVQLQGLLGPERLTRVLILDFVEPRRVDARSILAVPVAVLVGVVEELGPELGMVPASDWYRTII